MRVAKSTPAAPRRKFSSKLEFTCQKRKPRIDAVQSRFHALDLVELGTSTSRLSNRLHQPGNVDTAAPRHPPSTPARASSAKSPGRSTRSSAPAAAASFSAMKFSTVELLVNVIMSAPSALKSRERAAHILGLRHRAIGDAHVHDGAELAPVPLAERRAPAPRGRAGWSRSRSSPAP